MKRILYIVPMIMVLLIGCNRDPFAGWPEFPKVRFTSYSPYQYNQTVRFVNIATSDTLVFEVKESRFSYDMCDSPELDCYGAEDATLRFMLENESNTLEFMLTSFSDRHSIVAASEYVDVHYGLRTDVADRNDFPSMLTDTLRLTNDDSEYMLVVSRKGVVEFTSDGTVYQSVK